MRIVLSLMAIGCLILGLVALCNQPFHSALANDKAFFFSFGTGLFFTMLWMRAERKVSGTIPAGRKSK